jgi:hypothetical protein
MWFIGVTGSVGINLICGMLVGDLDVNGRIILK